MTKPAPLPVLPAMPLELVAQMNSPPPMEDINIASELITANSPLSDAESKLSRERTVMDSSNKSGLPKGTMLMDNKYVQECKVQCIAAIVQTYAIRKKKQNSTSQKAISSI